MQMIGITGGIGSGKSTIAKALAQRGYRVYDCDQEAKRIITENQSVRAAIIDLLGQEAFIGGQYNTAYVAQRVFAEPKLLQSLNAIVHPAVMQDIENNSHDLLFVESAILQESGLSRLCDKIIVVEAPTDVRVQRVIARDYNNLSTPENMQRVQARIAAQNIDFSHQPSTIFVRNDGKRSITELTNQILSQL